MGVPNSDLLGVERQRLELEGNILELQKSLYRWRTQEAEYDGLKEEFSDLDDTATIDDFLEVGRNYGGTLVTEEELTAIVNGQDATRTREQITRLVLRRLDNAKQNVTTLEKILRSAENKLHALDSIEQLPAEPTADFPMTEIVEELDGEGNIISSSTNTPGDEAQGLLELLKKAGVKDIPETPQTNIQGRALQESQDKPPMGGDSNLADKENETTLGEKEPPKPTPLDTKGSSQPRLADDKPSPSESSKIPEEHPVTDIDESPEDAQLRREMLRYSLDEVGAVVAELELDEDASDISVDEDADVFAYDEEDDSEEDEFGRSKHSVLDEDYHRQMRELESKLNARGMWNMGKDTESLPEELKEELQQPATVRIKKATSQTDAPVTEKKAKKKVAFADELDIAPAPKPPATEKKKLPPRQSDVPVLSDSVVERTEPLAKGPTPNDAPRKASRFKSARINEAKDPIALATLSEGSSKRTEPHPSLRKPQVPSSSASSLPLFPARPAEPKPFSQPISDVDKLVIRQGPQGQILANSLVEREILEGAAAPPEPDELDEQLHRKEIASEFYRMRNRLIKQNGGFVDEEPERVPIDTEDVPRVSKFKASRMS